MGLTAAMALGIGVPAAQAAAPPLGVLASSPAGDGGVVVRAARITAEGLLPTLAQGSDGGVVIRLYIAHATAYGMHLIRNQALGGTSWGLGIDSPGPVELTDLTADVTALGMRGVGLKLDVRVLGLTLTDVYLRCDRLTAAQVSLPSMLLKTEPTVPDQGTAPLLDLRTLVPVNGQGLADLINGILSGSGIGTEAKDAQGKSTTANPGSGSGTEVNGSVPAGGGEHGGTSGGPGTPAPSPSDFSPAWRPLPPRGEGSAGSGASGGPPQEQSPGTEPAMGERMPPALGMPPELLPFSGDRTSGGGTSHPSTGPQAGGTVEQSPAQSTGEAPAENPAPAGSINGTSGLDSLLRSLLGGR
ncbi:hypothetical protein [Kyrpidia spormannii]|uniref:Uncharacterized protein n=1 Tax=Kyrpidia spormannii TaxID=2055160 RepID=A0ACA8ZBB6_9BACL|nr:hypothetical protein [Kyrpidia spormannii]CAB3393367.1 conserved exported protein of unknown function [Kyrpidia spormannii]